MNFLVNRKVLIFMLFTGLVMLGVISYRRLSLELFPNTSYPAFFLRVAGQSEMSPEQMERAAIIPVEGAVGTLEGVKSINSQVSGRGGQITLEYEKDVDLKYAYLRLSSKVKEVEKRLPEGFRVSVSKLNTEALNETFMSMQLLGEGPIDQLRYMAEKEIIPRLEIVDGVANIDLLGGRQKVVEIRPDMEKCEAYGITPSKIQRCLSDNQRMKAYAGNLKEAGRTFFVNVMGEYHSVKEIEEVVIQPKGPVLLRDIAKVHFGAKDETSYSRVDGKNTVSLSVKGEALANQIDLAHRLKARVEEINSDIHPASLIIQKDMAKQLEDNLNGMKSNALIGAVLAVLVLWVFLRNLGMASVIALSIPVSAITAFNFFYACDISLNMLTMLGMVLALGMLLDNSVVVLENIYRFRAEGKTARQSVVQGVREVFRPVTASTLTTIAVFLPFVFSTDFAARLLGKHIGVSVISTMLISLLCAVLLIPMLSQFFMKDKHSGQAKKAFTYLNLNNKIVRYYLVFLKFCMRKPVAAFLGCVVIFFASMLTYFGVGMKPKKEVETQSIVMYATFPEQTSLKKADEKVVEISSKYEDLEEVERIYTTVQATKAEFTFQLKEDYKKIRGWKFYQIKNDIRHRVRRIRGVQISMDLESAQRASGRGMGGGASLGRMMKMMGLGEKRPKVVVQGLDLKKMRKFAGEVREKLRELSTVRGARMQGQSYQPEVHLSFDQKLMSRLGISYEKVANELKNSGKRELATRVELKQEDESFPVSIRLKDFEEGDLNLREMNAVEVPSDSGALTSVNEFSSNYFTWGKVRIQREDQEKKVSVSFSYEQDVNENSEALKAAQKEVELLVMDMMPPSGVTATVEHGEADYSEYTFLIFCAFLLIYMILASAFESLVTPLVLLFSIPLGLIGSVLLLLFSGTPADQYALMGVLILIGVVVNNGIILLDYARQLESEGFRKSRAIIQSGITRIRPVLITAATTVAALVPIALGEEQYMGAISQPFALTVIGGLTFSTLLTLILIPAFYSGMQSAIRWMRGLSPWAKTFQLFVLAGLYSMLYITLNSLIWQILWGTLGTMAVPALTYFLTESLKKASADVIPRGEPIHITIRHLSKVYGRPNQVKREWMAVQRIQRTLGLDGEYHSGYDRLKLLWQVPLMAFWAYLTFYYTKNPLWNFVFVILFNVLAVQFFKPLLFSFLNKKQIELLKKASYWVLPAVNMVYFFLSWESIGTAVVLLVALLVLLVGFDQNRRVEQKKKQWEKMNFVFRILGKFAKWIKSRWYPEEFRALKAVDLDIGQGMFGLLGPNGAGKSTLMRVICGILEQSYGKIWINGLDTQEKREELQGLIGFLPQEFGMYEKMSPASYLDYQAILKGLTDSEVRKERLRYVLESVHLYDRRHEPIGSFSGGMKQRVGIAQTLLHLPRILVVDEPTAGLDPKERIRFRNLLVELSSERVVIFSTHILEDVASACNRLAILKRGEIQFRGTPQSMTKVASGKVWEMTIAGDELDAWNENLIVTHHMQEDDGLRVRCLSPEAPTATAVPLPPNLEDAYLWLLKGKSMFEEKKQEYANA